VKNVEKQIAEEYEKNMRQNEKALSTVRKRKIDLEEQENMLHYLKIHSNRYLEEQKEIFFGTKEFARFSELENNVHDLTEMSRKQLEKERDDLEKEEKNLYTQEKIYYDEYQSALKKIYHKEDA
jgi:hypothetical protein